MPAAQTFVAGITGELDKVSVFVWIGKDNPGDLIAEIRSVDSSGAPTTTVLASTSVPQASIPRNDGSTLGYVDATFGSPAPVVQGTQYALVLSSVNDIGFGIGLVNCFRLQEAAQQQCLATTGIYDWGQSPLDVGPNAYPNGTIWGSGPSVPWSMIIATSFSKRTSRRTPRTTRWQPSLPSASAVAGNAGFSLTITGAGFAANSTIQWNGVPRATTFVSATQLTATILGADIATAGAAEVTVATPAPGGGISSPQAFFITATDTTVTGASSGTSTDPGGTATASTGGTGATTPGSLSASASGSGTVSVAQYAADPVPTPDPGGASAYFDVHVASGSAFSTLSVVDCNLTGTAGTAGYGVVDWWDGSQWSRVSTQQYDPTTNCTTLTFTGASAPTLLQLAGTPFAVVLDHTPPVTTATVSGTQGSNGWYTSSVSVAFTAKDDLSGVAKTTAAIDGGASQPSTAPFAVSGDGTHTVTYSSTDKAGNAEAAKSLTIKIDTTPPAITATATSSSIWPPNDKMVGVSVNVSLTDSGSGADGFILVSATASGDPSDLQGFVVGTASTSGQVRANKDEVYTLTYRGKDKAGNTTMTVVTITVPHDQGH